MRVSLRVSMEYSNWKQISINQCRWRQFFLYKRLTRGEYIFLFSLIIIIAQPLLKLFHTFRKSAYNINHNAIQCNSHTADKNILLIFHFTSKVSGGHHCNCSSTQTFRILADFKRTVIWIVSTFLSSQFLRSFCNDLSTGPSVLIIMGMTQHILLHIFFIYSNFH